MLTTVYRGLILSTVKSPIIIHSKGFKNMIRMRIRAMVFQPFIGKTMQTIQGVHLNKIIKVLRCVGT